MTRTLGLELASELALRLAARHDRVDLRRRTADDGLRRGGVHADFEVREIGEHRLELVSRVFDQRHQPDVVAEQHRLALTHQMGTRADDTCRVGERQPAREIGRRGLAQRLSDHRGGLGAMRLEHLAEPDLDREDGDVTGLDAVLVRIVEDELDDGVTTLFLHVRVDLVDPLGEDRIAQVQALTHLAVLGSETGHHPHRTIAHGPVGGVHVRLLLAFGHRAKALDGLLVIVGQHHGAGAAVVAARQRAPDGLQRVRLPLFGLHPVRQRRRGGLLARGQEARDEQRHNRSDRLLLGRLC
ncbi:Uncharacterised protein [Mycobacteroides abscessus subsp. abscessus]|nr:Uncharacterised protein [Mycobacteroides abscessus subsp. abscessus]